ncbi:hypothetical protein WA026_006384 [Henosepilachna vigintioctopunctata]|uniref:NADH-cytochrome b5 reductase n=1 Tax=Henosepilachna vigintioctopunctata TaxID=420089 RepID=A0AAW1TI93_9CUCU
MAVTFKMWGTVVPIAISVGVVIAGVIVLRIYNSKFAAKNGTEKSKKRKVLLEDPQMKYKIPLIEKEELSHDTRRFRFGLPSSDHVLGLPIGQHINIVARIGDELVIRSYTPVSSDDDKGYVDLVIKVYFKNVVPRFPDGGKMTQFLESLKINDCIEVRGPSGRLQYMGNGEFIIKKLRKDPPEIVKVNSISMIAGGTGITPMLQLIRHITKNETNKIKMALLFANQSERDILVRKELEEVAVSYPDQFKLWYTLDNAPPGWKYSTGFINEQMIHDHLLPPADNSIVLMCGPPPMINFACLPNLEKLNYNKDLCFAY